MTNVHKLLSNFEAQLRLDWNHALHGAEKTWFAVYDPSDERRIRASIGEFEIAVVRSGRKWVHLDLNGKMEQWLASSEYREDYFEDPDFLEMQYGELETHLKDWLIQEVSRVDKETLIGLSGVASLFGFVRVSNLVSGIAGEVKGRLLVLFPGSVEANTYRLLNARDGWNYRAVVITGDK